MSDSFQKSSFDLNFCARLPNVVCLSFIWAMIFHVKVFVRAQTTNQSGSSSSKSFLSKASVLEDIDSKLILIIIAVLLFVIVVAAIVFCWRCGRWERRRQSSPCKPRSGHSACSSPCACALQNTHAHHICMSGASGISRIATVCDPARLCHSEMCQSCMQMSRERTPPPAYLSGLGSSVSGRYQPERVAEQICSCGRNASVLRADVQQTEIPTSISESVRTEHSVPLRSHFPHDVTPQREMGFPENRAAQSLQSFSRTSNVTSDVVFYTPNDETLQFGERYPEDPHEPLNIPFPSMFDLFPLAVRDLFVPGQRSERREVAGKLVVSLTREVDHRGDILVLDNMGISLQIPPGAVARNKKQLVCLVLNWDLSDFPPIDNRQALISPVVYCGPHGLRLGKPCILSYKHCAFDPRMVQVLSSETELIDQKDWNLMCSEEDGGGAVCTTTDECQIRLQHFSLFTCVQTPPEGSTGKKWLQVAAFCAPLQREVHHYQVRVYFLNKTPCALQWAIQNEAKFGFRLACPERTFLFEGSGEDMHLSVVYVSRGWCAVRDDHQHHGQEEDTDTVSYHSIWHGKCPYLSFCFRRACISDQPHLLPPGGSYSPDGRRRAGAGVTSSTAVPGKLQPHVGEISLDFSIYQNSCSNRPDHMNLLLTEAKDATIRPTFRPDPTSSSTFPKLIEEEEKIPGCSPTCYHPTCNKHKVSVSMPKIHMESGYWRGKVTIDQNSPGHSVAVDFEPEHDCAERFPMPSCSEPGEVYPYELKIKLREKLDPQCIFGNDWMMLASKVGLDGQMHWLRERESPTLCVLEFMEKQRMDLVFLHRTLLEIQRLDAASLVEEVLNKLSIFHQMNEGVEHSDDP